MHHIRQYDLQVRFYRLTKFICAMYFQKGCSLALKALTGGDIFIIGSHGKDVSTITFDLGSMVKVKSEPDNMTGPLKPLSRA